MAGLIRQVVDCYGFDFVGRDEFEHFRIKIQLGLKGALDVFSAAEAVLLSGEFQQGHGDSFFADCGGHATVIRAPAELRAAIPVFQPRDPGLARLDAGLKASFDPRGVLNPGRIYAGV